MSPPPILSSTVANPNHFSFDKHPCPRALQPSACITLVSNAYDIPYYPRLNQRRSLPPAPPLLLPPPPWRRGGCLGGLSVSMAGSSGWSTSSTGAGFVALSSGLPSDPFNRHESHGSHVKILDPNPYHIFFPYRI